MKNVSQKIPWLILLLPFVIPALFYNSISNEVLIVRSFFSDEATFAPKTLFTVFRVPLIEITCAAAIDLMRRKYADNADYYAMWNILLYTVALKSLLQAFEIVSPRELANDFFYLTLGVVLTGIIPALFKGRRFFTELFRGKEKFSVAETAILIFILISYLGLAIVPIYVFQ
jgi:hypothetical protein